MHTNVNLAAPIGAMALLGTGFLLFVSALVLIQSLIIRKHGRAKFVVLVMLLIAAAYLTAILIFSLASHEKVLARGEEKHFCEIDCHLAYFDLPADVKATTLLINEGESLTRLVIGHENSPLHRKTRFQL